MTDLDAAIRAKLVGFSNDACLGGCGCEESRCGVYGFDEMRAALVAVLDRHKPNPHPSGLGPYCEVCVGGYEGVSEWPCQTVKDMATALGIEVPGE